ncbi:hypothetical protein ElyMa_002469300 [Elysia marginata]|uniref:EGF-like domain-containing protein n=1 Tax=Elysia marginata TaxID=1093978 RepID=A0AAV4GN22_9GAST|nr:hypothetical protein ElyMa_002469300 [Elysia marginata]
MTCPRGTYGPGCGFTCSDHCAGRLRECNHIDGTCLYGCTLGYSGNLCNLPVQEPFIDYNLAVVTAICAISTLVSVILAGLVLAPGLIAQKQETDEDIPPEHELPIPYEDN